MTSMVETLQAIVRQELARLRIAELGVVEALYPHAEADDKDNYGCDVKLKNSGLRLRRVPVATGHVGTAAVPSVGDLVLLAFDQGDVNQPIVIGRLYDDEDRPPLNRPDEVIFRLPLAEPEDKTIKAAVRNHQDESPARRIEVEMPPKISLLVDDGSVTATAGKTELKLDQPGGSGGTVTVVAGSTRITMDQDGDVKVEASGSMSLTARGDLKLEGRSVKIKGLTSASLEAGTKATVKGSATATLQGGAGATVQGATVQVKGVTSFSP